MPNMICGTKAALVIRADLLAWQVANVAAFLSGGLAGTYLEIVGEPYRDGDGRLYTPLIREPIFIYGATGAELSRTHSRAVNRGIRYAIYTEPLFKTTNDVDNRASVAATPIAALDLVGLGLHGDRKIIDKITGGHHHGSKFRSQKALWTVSPSGSVTTRSQRWRSPTQHQCRTLPSACRSLRIGRSRAKRAGPCGGARTGCAG
jgi:hypothetical protein